MEKICIALQDLTNPTKPTRICIPPAMGKGDIKSIPLKSGIQLIIYNFVPRFPFVIETAPPFKPIGFGFRLSGGGQGRASSTHHKFRDELRQVQAGFTCCTDLAELSETVGMERMVRVNIVMDLERFYTFAEGETVRLPPQLENPSQGRFNHNGQITPAMRTAIFDIFNCPYQGWAKNFFIESKVLELIAHKIGQIEAVDNRQSDTGHLPARDLERIREVARLLTGDLETPPDLNQLARTVGMCRSKMYSSFRMVFGVTPFEYLRNRRLETAMDFMIDGRMNVTQAAYAVGYSCPSHFSKAFKNYFGHLPSKNFIK
ncbi:AraC family transcriptional regulator [uncultured Desulfobacter sp.]|uniref:helix-turn-helix transcriptional regulator n=1 Tax=uncultured Desulfobacter sp. TaxID=240139 RepID=UPI002AA8480C|nr:AraC family transcriptional regulator [uncultured Desulfobacter sp.]